MRAYCKISSDEKIRTMTPVRTIPHTLKFVKANSVAAVGACPGSASVSSNLSYAFLKTSKDFIN